MSGAFRTKVIHAYTHTPYDKEERKNIVAKLDVLFLLRCECLRVL